MNAVFVVLALLTSISMTSTVRKTIPFPVSVITEFVTIDKTVLTTKMNDSVHRKITHTFLLMFALF